MNTILERGKRWIGKAALAAVAIAGFSGFLGAGTASAHPHVYVSVRPYPIYVGPDYYYGPRPVYVGPVYRPYGYYRYERPHRVYRDWDERNRCWRYR